MVATGEAQRNPWRHDFVSYPPRRGGGMTRIRLARSVFELFTIVEKDHRRRRSIPLPRRTMGGHVHQYRAAHDCRAWRAGRRRARFNPHTHRRRPRPRQIARPAYGATAKNDGGAEAGSAAKEEGWRIRRRPCAILWRVASRYLQGNELIQRGSQTVLNRATLAGGGNQPPKRRGYALPYTLPFGGHY